MLTLNNIFKKHYTYVVIDVEFLTLNQTTNQSNYSTIENGIVAFIQPIKGALESGFLAYTTFRCWIDAEQLTNKITTNDRIIQNNTIYRVVDVELHNNLQNMVIKPFYLLILEKSKND